MSMGAIGNAIYVNQQTVTVSDIQNAHNNRIDFQNMIAQASANEKEEKVLEIRPAEDNQGVDPDREHQKNEADQETARNKRKKEKEDEIDSSEYEVHSLDIKV